MLEALPTEIFHHILRVSSSTRVLNLKLTSRALYHKSKHADGSEVVKTTSRAKRNNYISNLFDLEMNIPEDYHLRYLTCRKCGKIKPHGVEGFSDDHFDQERPDRQCLRCQYESQDFTIDGEEMFRCARCLGVDSMERMPDRETVGELLVRYDNTPHEYHKEVDDLDDLDGESILCCNCFMYHELETEQCEMAEGMEDYGYSDLSDDSE